MKSSFVTGAEMTVSNGDLEHAIEAFDEHRDEKSLVNESLN